MEEFELLLKAFDDNTIVGKGMLYTEKRTVSVGNGKLYAFNSGSASIKFISHPTFGDALLFVDNIAEFREKHLMDCIIHFLGDIEVKGEINI